MNRPMVINQDSAGNIKLSDCMLKILTAYMILIVLVKFYLANTAVSAMIPYASVVLEAALSVYIIYYNKWNLSLNSEATISILYLITTLYFTMMHAGYASAITAVFKEYVVLFVCVFLRNRTYTMKTFKNVIRVLVVFGVITILAAMVYDNMLSEAIHPTNIYMADIKSFFNSKNQFGRVLYLSTICVFFLFTTCEKKVGKIFYLALTAVFGLATAMTFSRTSLMSVALFFLFYYFLTPKEKTSRKIAVIAFGVLAFLFVVTNDFLMDYITRYIIREDVGIESRSDIWVIGLEYIQHHPLVGAGEYMAEKVINQGGIPLFEFHNQYVYRMFVSGIPMAILWGWLIIKRFIVLIKKLKTNPIMDVSLAMLLSFMAYMCLEQYSIFQFSYTGLFIILFLYIGPNVIEEDEIIEQEECA